MFESLKFYFLKIHRTDLLPLKCFMHFIIKFQAASLFTTTIIHKSILFILCPVIKVTLRAHRNCE